MRKTLLAIFMIATSALAADFTGNWSGQGVSGKEGHPLNFVFKQDGDKLSGSIGPGAAGQMPFTDGKVEGDKIVFEIPGARGQMRFDLMADGDGLKGTIEFRSSDSVQSAAVIMKKAT